MKKILPLIMLWMCLSLGMHHPGVNAQVEVEVISQEVEYSFGDEMVFRIQYASDQEIESVTLFLETPGVPTFVGAVSFTDDGAGFFSYDLVQRPLPAFSTINYHYQFSFQGGEVAESPSYHLTYLDNRYNWQELIDEPFRIYWYQGEITLAQEVLDAAVEGQTKILDLLQQPPDDQPITIFIYASEEDLQSTLANIGQGWVSGHADPARGAMVVALPPAVDQPLEIQRLIPHELAHILLYRFMGAEYQYLPAWFSEGLASQMEAYSLPEYKLALERAYEARDLIPFAHICQAFPPDGELALLSYAQSESLVGYLQREYGVSSLQAMINAYDQGVSCERGVETALGMTLQDLEKEWQRATFGSENFLLYILILSGLLVILLLILGLFIFKKTRKAAEDDWGEDEDDYESDE